MVVHPVPPGNRRGPKDQFPFWKEGLFEVSKADRRQREGKVHHGIPMEPGHTHQKEAEVGGSRYLYETANPT